MDFSTSLANVKTLKLERKFLQSLKILDDILDDLEPIHKQKRVKLLIAITNLLLIVTRYFGGTKLGTGGLVRAYGNAAQAVLDISNFLNISLSNEQLNYICENLYGTSPTFRKGVIGAWKRYFNDVGGSIL